MTKYVHFNPEDGYVLNWLNTKAFNYSAMPPQDCLLEINDEQYKNRHAEKMMVKNGELVPYVAPMVPVIDQQEIKRFGMRLNAYQIRLALKTSGFTSEHLFDAAPEEIKLAWEHSPEFRRTGIVANYLLAKLGINDEELDKVFSDGKLIRA